MAKDKDPYMNAGFEAVPAVVVADQTDQSGKRLGYLAFALLLLFFAVNGYISSAQNGEELEQARKDRAALTVAIEKALAQSTEDRDIILTFGAIIAEQNRRLMEAGLDPVEIDPLRPLPEQTENAPSISSNEANPPASLPGAPADSPTRNVPPAPEPSSPNPAPAPAPQPAPQPTPEPEPEPEGPLDPITEPVCNALGICL